MNLYLTPISTSPGLQGFLLLIVEAASPPIASPQRLPLATERSHWLTDSTSPWPVIACTRVPASSSVQVSCYRLQSLSLTTPTTVISEG